MGDTFAVEVFDPSLLFTNLRRFERVVPGDRVGRCDSLSYLGAEEESSSSEETEHDVERHVVPSPRTEKRTPNNNNNKHTLIYRMFHVTPNLQPSGKPFSPKQHGRSSENMCEARAVTEAKSHHHLHGGGDIGRTRAALREVTSVESGSRHGILRVVDSRSVVVGLMDSGQSGSSAFNPALGPSSSSSLIPVTQLKREGMQRAKSDGDIVSKDLVVTALVPNVKSDPPHPPLLPPSSSKHSTTSTSPAAPSADPHPPKTGESDQKFKSPLFSAPNNHHGIFYRIFHEVHDAPENPRGPKKNGPPSPKSSRRLSVSGKQGGDHSTQQQQHHSIFKDLIESGSKLKRSRSLDKIGKLTRSHSDASLSSLSEKYGQLHEVLGKGAHAVVQLAHKKDMLSEKLYAVKRFRKRPKDELPKEHIKKLTAEFCIASTLHHENVCETVDLIQDENENWCEVMEYCPGGDLYMRIKAGPMNQLEIDCFFKQLIHGLAYIHSMGVAHR